MTEVATLATATQPPDSATNSNCTGSINRTYNANETTIADQLNKSRRNVADGPGLLAQAVKDPTGLNYQTSYLNDSLGNLRKVTQSTQCYGDIHV